MTTTTTTKRDPAAHAAMMRQRLADSLLLGHACSMCARVEIPTHLPLEVRQAMAQTLWRIHLTNASRVAQRNAHRRNKRVTA